MLDRMLDIKDTYEINSVKVSDDTLARRIVNLFDLTKY